MIFSLAVIFCIRSLLLAIFEAKSWPKQLFHGLCAAAFGCVTLFVKADFDPAFTFFAALAVGLSLLLRFYGVLRHNFWIRFTKGVVFGSFALAAIAACCFSGFLHLTDGREIARIVITGKQTQSWAEWKNPDTAYCEAFVDSYEVLLKKPDGSLIRRFEVFGDLVGVRAEVVRLRPFLNFLGIPNACRIESVYNGYRTMERHRDLPHLGIAVPFSNPLLSLLWEKLFYLKWRSLFVQAATLESNYFPLQEPASYSLTLSAGGLSASLTL